MSRSPLRRWGEGGSPAVAVSLRFVHIMVWVAFALLALSPEELARLDWSFADRKRLLDHLLKSGKQAQSVDREKLDQTLLNVTFRARDVRRLKRFARRELPKTATHAAVIERLSAVLEAADPEKI
mgnify:CR=1 FL=1